MVSLFCHRGDVVMRTACFYCFLFSTYDFAVFFNFYQNLIVQIFIILSIITFKLFFRVPQAIRFCLFFCLLSWHRDSLCQREMGFWFSRSESYILGLEIASPLASLYFSPSTISLPSSLLPVSITVSDREYYLVLQNATRLAVVLFY